jgi:flagellin
MALTVATNSGALMAQAAASSVNKSMETSMERLATGKRINSASDDAAGVAIASRLTSEIRGTNMAIRNAMDGQSLIDTAEGAHVEVENILQRMRELAVQSANDTNSTVDRSYLQAEVEQLTSEIDRISSTTSWAGINLLDGSFTTKKFQVGSGSGTLHEITTSMNSMASAAIGVHRLDGTADGRAAVAIGSITDPKAMTSMVVTGGTGAATVTSTAGDSVKTLATLVNAKTSQTGVTATAATNVKLSAISHAGTVTFNLLGNNTTAQAFSVSVVDKDDLTSLKDAINAVAGGTGITAAFDGSAKSALILTDADGDDIQFNTYTNSGNSVATLKLDAMNFDATATSGTQVAITEVNNSTIIGGTIRMEGSAAFTAGTQTGNTTGTGNTGYFGTGVSDSSALTATSAIDVGTLTGAKSAIDILDGAMRMVSTQRADLGSVSNRIDSTVNNLTNIVSNLDAGRGRIEDADFAAETTNLAKTQILQQASTAMLAQANASKQGVLSLLQG